MPEALAGRSRAAQARAMLDAIARRESADPEIDATRMTRGWTFDHVAPVGVLLIHGLTNSPPQYDLLAQQLYERGHAVIVPRMPYHGYHDRLTEAFAALRATDLERATLEGLAIAALCGRRIVVAGISVGAVIAGWLAARTRVDTAVAIAPFCGLRALPGRANDALGLVLRSAPNRFGWWDPRRKEGQPPEHGYPRFSTRTLGESLLISTRMEREPRMAGVHGRRAIVLYNANDPAVNNCHARGRFEALRPIGVAVEHITLHGLPRIHDIVEPAIPEARPDLVYPKLIELMEAE